MPRGARANENRGPIRSDGSAGACPCIWMSAGLVSYKLCDRELDCEHCPLDAALRGGALSGHQASFNGVAPRAAAFYFPDDRLYGEGHTWVREGAGREVRVGLDGFATALLGGVSRVVREGQAERLEAGDPLCSLDLGIGRLAVAAPVAGHARRWNEALEDDAGALADAPYEDGWIVELELTGAGALADLVSSERALDRTRLDLRRFRRRAAMFLFDQADAVGPTLADGGEILTDLRFMLGAQRYLDLIDDLIR